MDKIDRGSYERLSIRDSIRESAQSLRKYGSTSKHVMKNENYIKHFVTNTDTLQGIALKYNVTIEQIHRANKLWTSDSLFLREYLLIPSEESSSSFVDLKERPKSISSLTSPSNSSFDEEDIGGFLSKIDAAIATSKEGVKKTSRSNEFVDDFEEIERRLPPVSRMKQMVNNNSSNNVISEQGSLLHNPNSIVVQQGTKARTSPKQHEQHQDEFFEL
ncbi:lysM and putative peptidoglycan-binding domain-containing protein 1 [Diorhabda carinulata]|uniref:lysM and putative peptidoglycan-binding domain-containing protein 1 n=1 Tax=Diorhabda carinulata TaxID=1163345 RepID=UPI0025A2DA36|nr:lysM and putative peptidoglycan-binding domain-containing protein 1 [Diorhabda carinulata]